MSQFKGMVTSDWSECLAPSGPFDMIVFHYPRLRDPVEAIFRGYTGNDLSLARAAAKIRRLMPAPLDQGQMDAYIDAAFAVYADASALMDWCRRHHILFMINSTGAMGYFQRVFAGGRMPTPAALAAHPMIRYAPASTDPELMLPIEEINDKPVKSAAVARRFGIDPGRIVVIGDSGGDGPHFEWGARVGATLVASLAKPSLTDYCRRRGIAIHYHWDPGPATDAPGQGPPADRAGFRRLASAIRSAMSL